VKTDLAAATEATRRARGEVLVFDPAGITTGVSARWDPLAVAGTIDGAQQTAELLVDPAGATAGSTDRFWRAQASQLLAGLLWTAANQRTHTDPTVGLATVVDWILTLDRPDDRRASGVTDALTVLAEVPGLRADTTRVHGWLQGVWGADPRTSASVYLSARDAVWPWTTPTAAATATGHDVTLEWLTAGANTLHVVLPLGDEHRHGRLAAAVIGHLIADAFTRANRHGPLTPGLLVVLDEAANTPLGNLPRWSATVTGAGIQLVTIWQTIAQQHALYGADADTLAANHRTKLFHGASHDRATLDYAAWLPGTEHLPGTLPTRLLTPVVGDSTTATGVPLLTADMIRQLPTGDTLLIHGNLPPIHLER
jgi:type IV secretion system protein VirD4